MSLKMEGAVGLAEAKDNLSALTAKANETGEPFVLTKNNKPWVEVRPVAAKLAEEPGEEGAILIQPVRRTIDVVDLDDLFAEYDGGYKATEDGFASPMGEEEL